MKDLRRWGMGLIVAMLVLSMGTSIAMGTTVGSRGGSDRPSDSGGGEPSVEFVGDPQDGNGGGLPKETIQSEGISIVYFWMSLKQLILGRTIPMPRSRPTSLQVRVLER